MGILTTTESQFNIQNSMKKFFWDGAFAATLTLGAAYSYSNSNASLSDLQML